MRAKSITNLYEEISLQKKEDVSSDLRTSNRKRNQIQFQNVGDKIKETMNPFSDVQPNLLFNIGSGKAASQETTNFLLHVVEYGNNARDKFVDECAKNPAHFTKSITRTNVKTYSSEGKKF